MSEEETEIEDPESIVEIVEDYKFLKTKKNLINKIKKEKA